MDPPTPKRCLNNGNIYYTGKGGVRGNQGLLKESFRECLMVGREDRQRKQSTDDRIWALMRTSLERGQKNLALPKYYQPSVAATVHWAQFYHALSSTILWLQLCMSK